MDYNKLFKKISDEVLNAINEKYTMDRLNNELKMDMPFDSVLLCNLVHDNCKEVLSALTDEQKEGFSKFCEDNKENCKNTMLATKYEDGNLFAISFVEYKISGAVPTIVNVEKSSPDFSKRIHIIDDDYEL